MRFVLAILLTALFGLMIHQFLPWWSIVLGGFLTGVMIKMKSIPAFLAALIGGVLLWGSMALWTNFDNEGILAARIGELFGGIGESGILSVTALLGGIYAAFGALTGNLLRQLVINDMG
ncbi:MAG: hypothetical protein DWQ02_19960 [Bacteroidetes bacterium]|nr:MAG: hypothetical protein DWQ02_19960 [Bacteroidota bacterium]